MLPADQDQPPIKPARLRVRMEETGAGLSLSYRQRQWGSGLFLIFWLCGWTAGCVFLAVMVWKNPEPILFVFVVPFWASWFFAASMILTMFLQLEELTLDENGLSYLKTILLPIQRRSIPLLELTEFIASLTTRTSDDEAVTSYVELRSLGQPLLMLANLSDGERQWLTWRLNQQLRVLNPEVENEDDTSFTSVSRANPPSDCAWTCDDTYEGLTFVRRGHFSLVALLSILFINLFWNGIVSVFVMALFGGAPGGPARFAPEWWGMMLFLLPFEAIGLIMVVAFLAVLFEPAHRTTWRIDRNEIALCDSWLGIGRTRRYDASRIASVRFDVRETPSYKLPNVKTFTPQMRTTASQDFHLRLVDRDNVEIVTLNDLTEGEARWVISELERDYPAWFR